MDAFYIRIIKHTANQPPEGIVETQIQRPMDAWLAELLVLTDESPFDLEFQRYRPLQMSGKYLEIRTGNKSHLLPLSAEEMLLTSLCRNACFVEAVVSVAELQSWSQTTRCGEKTIAEHMAEFVKETTPSRLSEMFPLSAAKNSSANASHSSSSSDPSSSSSGSESDVVDVEDSEAKNENDSENDKKRKAALDEEDLRPRKRQTTMEEMQAVSEEIPTVSKEMFLQYIQPQAKYRPSVIDYLFALPKFMFKLVLASGSSRHRLFQLWWRGENLESSVKKYKRRWNINRLCEKIKDILLHEKKVTQDDEGYIELSLPHDSVDDTIQDYRQKTVDTVQPDRVFSRAKCYLSILSVISTIPIYVMTTLTAYFESAAAGTLLKYVEIAEEYPDTYPREFKLIQECVETIRTEFALAI